MPTYDYRCSSCDSTFEVFQQISEKPIKRCTQCGGTNIQRLIGTGGGIIFKGSGFYQTDYRSEEYKSMSKVENKTCEPSDKKSDTKDTAVAVKK